LSGIKELHGRQFFVDVEVDSAEGLEHNQSQFRVYILQPEAC